MIPAGKVRCTRCDRKRHVAYASIVGTRWCQDCYEAVAERKEPIVLAKRRPAPPSRPGGEGP